MALTNESTLICDAVLAAKNILLEMLWLQHLGTDFGVLLERTRAAQDGTITLWLFAQQFVALLIL